MQFGSLKPKALKHLITGEEIPVINGIATVDIDRKCGEIYRIVV